VETTSHKWRSFTACSLAVITVLLQTGFCRPAAALDTLTPGAREAAELLGILPKVERLIELKRSNGGSDTMSDEMLALKVDVLDKVMAGTLEVRMVSGRIDREVAWAFSGQGMLEARRQRILNSLFTANFMQGGVLGVLSGPAFLHNEPKTGTILLLLASSIGLGLSSMSLLASRSGTKKIDGGTTVLADVYHLNQPEQDHNPLVVMKFLNSVPPQSLSKKTRIENLMDGWQRAHYLRSTSESNLQKMAALESAVGKQRENIRLISDRIRMLFDTQYTVQELDVELLDLLRVADIN
jgi:hypothetical protein